jgi:hypothetical protein
MCVGVAIDLNIVKGRRGCEKPVDTFTDPARNDAHQGLVRITLGHNGKLVVRSIRTVRHTWTLPVVKPSPSEFARFRFPLYCHGP